MEFACTALRVQGSPSDRFLFYSANPSRQFGRRVSGNGLMDSKLFHRFTTFFKCSIRSSGLSDDFEKKINSLDFSKDGR
jgi:hypothetical protein